MNRVDVVPVDFTHNDDVVELDISVENVPGVHVTDGGEELSHDVPDDVLAEDELVDKTEKIAAFTEFCDHE